jgi:hypothetical protein
MHHPDRAAALQHDQHDPDLIASFAADDLVETDRDRAQALLDACSECRVLHDDLLAITRAIHVLPGAAAPRDFRLTADQAARFGRRTGLLARILAPFAAAGSVAKPLAATFTALGLVGVFVASAGIGMLGGAASMAAPESVAGPAAGAGNPGAMASAAPGMQFGPAATSGSDGQQITKDSTESSSAPLVGQAGDGDNRDLGADGERLDAQPRPANPFLLGSLALLAAGLVLFGLRFLGRRVR